MSEVGSRRLGIEVLRERLADAAHEIAHQAGAADLRQRASQRVADDDIDAGCLPAGSPVSAESR